MVVFWNMYVPEWDLSTDTEVGQCDVHLKCDSYTCEVIHPSTMKNSMQGMCIALLVT